MSMAPARRVLALRYRDLDEEQLCTIIIKARRQRRRLR